MRSVRGYRFFRGSGCKGIEKKGRLGFRAEALGVSTPPGRVAPFVAFLHTDCSCTVSEVVTL